MKEGKKVLQLEEQKKNKMLTKDNEQRSGKSLLNFEEKLTPNLIKLEQC